MEMAERLQKLAEKPGTLRNRPPNFWESRGRQSPNGKAGRENLTLIIWSV